MKAPEARCDRSRRSEPADARQHGARVVHSTEPQLILDDLSSSAASPGITTVEVGMPASIGATEMDRLGTIRC